MVAAATMSLPERAQAGRNYDYRYVWIRDQCYAGQAVAADGPHRLLDDAVDFVASRLLDDGPQLKPAYTITGGAVPDEHTLSRLAGYPGGSDKAGNWVNKQFQLDALGEALLLFAAAARHDHLDSWHWRAAETAVAAIKARQADADAGVWELDDQRWAHSRLMCVAGLRAIAAAGAAPGRPANGRPSPTPSWPTWPGTACTPPAAGSALPATSGTTRPCCCRPSGAPPRPTDPRALATLAAVMDDLASDGYLYRFRHDQRPLHEAEGAFVLVRVPDGPGPAPAGPRNRSGGLVRAQPGRLRPAGAADRGVRRHPAAAARQYPPGLCPRPAVRMRRPPDQAGNAVTAPAGRSEPAPRRKGTTRWTALFTCSARPGPALGTAYLT